MTTVDPGARDSLGSILARITLADTPSRLRLLWLVIGQAQAGGRITRAQANEARAAYKRREVEVSGLALVAKARVGRCPWPGCDGVLWREIGAIAGSDLDGEPWMDQVDVCDLDPTHHRPAEVERLTTREVRRRVRVVERHEATVADHSGCGEDQPCKAVRPYSIKAEVEVRPVGGMP